jgi:hypothetical protein
MKFIPPKRIHESNIQAEVYRRLRNAGIKCFLEYPVYCPKFNSSIRVDVIIIKDNEIKLFIECKSRKRNKEPYKKGQQYLKYKSLNMPLIYCMDFNQAVNILDAIKPYL